MSSIPNSLRWHDWARRTSIRSRYESLSITQDRKARVDGSLADANEAYKEFTTTRSDVIADYEDLMEYFDVMAMLGADTNSVVLDMGLNGTNDLIGYEPIPFNQDLTEYSNYLQDQLVSDFPAVASMSQAEFMTLLTASLRELYDENGSPYWTADLDIPIPSGYTSITVRISEV